MGAKDALCKAASYNIGLPDTLAYYSVEDFSDSELPEEGSIEGYACAGSRVDADSTVMAHRLHQNNSVPPAGSSPFGGQIPPVVDKIKRKDFCIEKLLKTVRD